MHKIKAVTNLMLTTEVDVKIPNICHNMISTSFNRPR